jgi:hypothetical protein
LEFKTRKTTPSEGTKENPEDIPAEIKEILNADYPLSIKIDRINKWFAAGLGKIMSAHCMKMYVKSKYRDVVIMKIKKGKRIMRNQDVRIRILFTSMILMATVLYLIEIIQLIRQ